MAKTRVYRKGVLEAENFPVADVSEYLEQPDTIVWVDLCEPTEQDMHVLVEELGLHELAVEDALGPHQRPKVDHYATHLFLSCHAVPSAFLIVCSGLLRAVTESLNTTMRAIGRMPWARIVSIKAAM